MSFTASSLPRLLNCLGSAVLARAEVVNEWSTAGTDEHAELAEQLGAGTLPDEIAALFPPGARAEVAMAYDVATGAGRIIGENIGRAYGPLGPFEIPGTADVLGVEGDAVIVGDYKTGYNESEKAETNGQLWHNALTAAKALGKSRAIIRIIYTKTGRVDEAEAGPLELAEFAGQLHRLFFRIAEARKERHDGAPVSTREGPWCRHCSSKSICPSKVGLLVQVASGGLAVLGDTTMTPARAREGYEQIVRLEGLIKDARARLNTYVEEQGPIDLGDGRMYGRYFRKGNEKLDGAVAVRAIREVLGERAAEFEKVAIEHSTSKAAIERAAKAISAPKLAKAVIEKVRELGGATSSPTWPVGEYSRGKDEPAEKPAIDTEQIDQMLRLVK